MQDFLRHWVRRETVGRAIKVALVVGPVLTVINQYDLLLAGDFSAKLVFKILLTFVVPYSVSSYSSAKAYLEEERRRATGAGEGARARSTAASKSTR